VAARAKPSPGERRRRSKANMPGVIEVTPEQELECALLSGKEIAERLLNATNYPQFIRRQPWLVKLQCREEWERVLATFEMCRVLVEQMSREKALPSPTAGH